MLVAPLIQYLPSALAVFVAHEFSAVAPKNIGTARLLNTYPDRKGK